MQANSPQEYWAASATDELGDEVRKRIDSYYQHMDSRGLFSRMRNAYREYYSVRSSGLFDDGDVQEGGEQGEIIIARAGHFRNLVQHTLVMTTGTRPSFEPRATNLDSESQEQCVIAQGILEYYLREKRLERKFNRAAEAALLFGRGYLRITWDATAGKAVEALPQQGPDGQPVMGPDGQPALQQYNEGDVRVDVLTPFDVVKDPRREWSEIQWCIVRSRVNKYDLASQYPEYHDEILAQDDQPQDPFKYAMTNALPLAEHSDEVWVYEFYHRKTQSLPSGRYALVLHSGCVLLDGPLPYDDIPVYAISPGEIFESSDGYTSFWDIINLQRISDAILSSVSSNIDAHGVQNIAMEEGTDLSPEVMSGGANLWTIPQGGKPPVGVNLTAMPQGWDALYALLVKDMETLTGVNAVQRGNPEASLKSGSALLLVQQMAVQYQSAFQGSYTQLVEDGGTGLIGILKRYANTDRMAMIAGADRRYMLQTWSGKDLSNIERVVVDVGNPMSHNAAGRTQLGEWYMQIRHQGGTVEDFMNMVQIVTTGKIDGFEERPQKEKILIRSENEALRKGPPCAPIPGQFQPNPMTGLPDPTKPKMSVQGVPAIFADHHRAHIEEHAAELASLEARANPQVVQAVLCHIQEHIDLLKNTDPDVLEICGEQPLQNIAAQLAAMQGQKPGGGNGSGAPSSPGKEPPAPTEDGQPPQGGAAARRPQMPKNPLAGERPSGPQPGSSGSLSS